jgi:hypothetical protein
MLKKKIGLVGQIFKNFDPPPLHLQFCVIIVYLAVLNTLSTAIETLSNAFL